jgi:glycine hydroxymethyltransferase
VDPSGVRMGTSWVTQRGFGVTESKRLAKLIGQLLMNCKPYSQAGRRRPLKRAKVDFTVLNKVKQGVRELALEAGIDFEPTSHSYPHFYYLDDPLPEAKFVQVALRGEVEAFLRWTTTARPGELKPGAMIKTQVSLPEGQVDAVIERPKKSETDWRLTLPAESAAMAIAWLRDLSDGYVTVDPGDLHKKLPGPVVVELIGGTNALPEAKADDQGADKPWSLMVLAEGGKALPDFEWTEEEADKLKVTTLNKTHREMGAKMVPFAGWDMPVWYSSVREEHNATRQAAGLFDVSHMGVYQVEGASACTFLDSVVTNDVAALDVGQSHYTQFLDPDAMVIDDCMVYRRGEDIYLVVVNASNDDKDWAWLNAVKDGKVRIDGARPWAKAFGRGCTLRNLRDTKEADDRRVDIALQGPKSREILLAMGCEEEVAAQLQALPWAGVMEGEFGGIDLVVSRTGYTGERIAFELFVHPKNSARMWKKLIKVGEPFGLKPVGLGARDSLRTEAGLPLYGHEMAGEMNFGVGHAGFSAYVKTYKPWFIGREAYLAQEAERIGEVTRFRFNEKGVRMAHSGDPVVDGRGRVIGVVTSCAVDAEGFLLGQAYLEKKALEPGTQIAVFQSATEEVGKAPAALGMGDRVAVPTPATVLTRFP